jgi:hypothetical protein
LGTQCRFTLIGGHPDLAQFAGIDSFDAVIFLIMNHEQKADKLNIGGACCV